MTDGRNFSLGDCCLIGGWLANDTIGKPSPAEFVTVACESVLFTRAFRRGHERSLRGLAEGDAVGGSESATEAGDQVFRVDTQR
jgi:hypothetical protein